MFCSNCNSQVNDDAVFCPFCGQHFNNDRSVAKYKDVKKAGKSEAKERDIIAVTNISAEELATPLNEKERIEVKKRNLYYLICTFAVMLFMLLHFIPSDLEIDVYISSIPDTMLFGEILLNFAGPFQTITFALATVSIWATFFINQSTVARYKKIALVSGVISAFLQVLYAISVFSMSKFNAETQVFGETIYYLVKCKTAIPGLLVLLSALATAVSVYTSHKKEIKLQKLMIRDKYNQ